MCRSHIVLCIFFFFLVCLKYFLKEKKTKRKTEAAVESEGQTRTGLLPTLCSHICCVLSKGYSLSGLQFPQHYNEDNTSWEYYMK